MVPTAASGRSLSTVVTSCTCPAVRTPCAFTSVSVQSAVTAAANPAPGEAPSTGQKTVA